MKSHRSGGDAGPLNNCNAAINHGCNEEAVRPDLSNIGKKICIYGHILASFKFGFSL